MFTVFNKEGQKIGCYKTLRAAGLALIENAKQGRVEDENGQNVTNMARFRAN